MTDTVWIVGRWVVDESWQFQGVFLTNDEAIAACRDGSYFVGPAVIGQSISHEKVEWPGVVYPLAKTS